VVRGETYNEPMALIIYILLQRRLTQALGKVGASTMKTNLIIHHGVADILDQAAKLIHILGAVQERRDPALLCQWGKVSKNVIQFSNESYKSDRPSILESVYLPFKNLPPLFLFDLTLRNRCTQRLCQPFNPGYQRFYRLATPHRLLGQP